MLLAVEARYPHQVWEIEVPLRHGALAAPEHAGRRSARTSTRHTKSSSPSATAPPRSSSSPGALTGRCRLRTHQLESVQPEPSPRDLEARRRAYFPRLGLVEVDVRAHDTLTEGERLSRSPDRRVTSHHRRARRARSCRAQPTRVAAHRPAARRPRGQRSGRAMTDTRTDRRGENELPADSRPAQQPLRGDRPRDDEHAASHGTIRDPQHRTRLLLLHPHRRATRCWRWPKACPSMS